MDKAVRMEKAYLQRAKKETYKERRKEGRTKHGQTSWASIIIGVFAWLLQVTAILTPNWRASWVGVLGYPHPRKWGLWAIAGAKTQYYHEYSTTTCGFYGQLNVGGLCASPICLWYKQKCSSSIDFWMVGYGVGIGFVVELIIHMLCIFWTVRLTPKFLRWASIWYPVAVVMHVGGLVAWILVTEAEFDELGAKSYYPTPPPGLGVIMSSIAGAGLVICAFFSCLLKAMWPEVDLENLDSDSSEASSADEDEPKKQQGSGPPGPMSQEGYSPMAPPMGYDPAGPMGMAAGMALGMAPGMAPVMAPGMGPGMHPEWGPDAPLQPEPGLEPAWGPPQPMPAAMPGMGNAFDPSAPPPMGPGGALGMDFGLPPSHGA